MIKSILVALDKSKASETARKLALQLAKTYHASLSGIGILDEPWLIAPEAVPLGGAAFKVELDEQILKKTRAQVHDLEQQFEKHCASENVPCSIVDAVGIPAFEIKHFLTEHDLLVMGKDATFHFNDLQETSPSLKQLVTDNPRPVVLTGRFLLNEESENILVGFDGSIAASRSLHLALLLGVLKGKTIHITSISHDEDEARDWVNVASRLCEHHKVKATLHPMKTIEKPAKKMLELAKDIRPSLIVIGAYGHNGLSYLFKGSCMKTLVAESDIPLFLYH